MKSWQVKGMEGGITEGSAQTPFGKLPSFGIWEDRKETDEELLGLAKEESREGSPNFLWGCRCGRVHEGEYAREDWGHHQCLHEAELIGREVEVAGPKLPKGACPEWSRRVQVICPQCGQSWIASIPYEETTPDEKQGRG